MDVRYLLTKLFYMKSITNWETISQEYIYKSKWLRLRHDKVIQPDGAPGEYDVLEKNDFVIVVGRIENKFLLVDQDRYPVGERSLEFPQGNIEKGETPEAAAMREFEEETGYRSGWLINLGKIWLATGYSNQSYYVFYVEGGTKGKAIRDGSEADMEVRILSKTDIEKAILNGEIKDATTINAYSIYTLKKSKFGAIKF